MNTDLPYNAGPSRKRCKAHAMKDDEYDVDKETWYAGISYEKNGGKGIIKRINALSPAENNQASERGAPRRFNLA